MRLAWFHARTAASAHPCDDTAGLLRALGAEHELHTFTSTNAHDFMRTGARAPYDVCVFELDDTPAHAFIWPYLLHHAGVLLLRTRTLHDSRAHALVDAARLEDYVAEFTFSEGHPPRLAQGQPYLYGDGRPMLRVPLLAARLAVLPQQGVAQALQEEYPEARIRYAPVPVQPVQPLLQAHGLQQVPGPDVTFGVLSTDRVEVARRVVARARETGAAAALVVNGPERVLQQADVLLLLQWPGFGEPQQLAVSAMAGGKPVVVLETEGSADWPVLDPQTWRPRGFAATAPIGVSLDLRDEEHSLILAVRRLAADVELRRRLGAAGQAWWRAHATVDRAAEVWRRLLREAAVLDPPPRPATWPAHLNAERTEDRATSRGNSG
ncbi:MAG: glycosyltransferase [Vicinamibacterales bacterium]